MSEKLLVRAGHEATHRKAIESQPVQRDVQPEVTDEWLPFIGVTPHTITHVGGVLREQALLHLQHTVGNHAVQRTVDRSRSTSITTDDLAQRIRAASISGSPLDAAIRDRLEADLDADLSSVQIHTDDEADRLSRSVHALAFTTGQHIFFRQGEYQPDTIEGLHLIAHEATHTLQQMNAPTIDRISISDPSDDLECDASHAADQIVEGKQPSTSRAAIGEWQQASLQRQTPAEKRWIDNPLYTVPGGPFKDWSASVGALGEEDWRLKLGGPLGGGFSMQGNVGSQGWNLEAGGPVLGPYGSASFGLGSSGASFRGSATLPFSGEVGGVPIGPPTLSSSITNQAAGVGLNLPVGPGELSLGYGTQGGSVGWAMPIGERARLQLGATGIGSENWYTGGMFSAQW